MISQIVPSRTTPLTEPRTPASVLQVFIPLFLLLLPLPSLAQTPPVLHGRLLLVDTNGLESPAPAGIEVTILESTATDRTDSKGLFRLPLKTALLPGSLITLDVTKPDYAIWQPEAGKTPIPQGLLTVKLLAKGSKRWWTDTHIQTFIEDTAEKAKLQIKPSSPNQPKKPIDFAPLIRDWATKYGFTPDEAKAQIEKWSADVEKAQDDFYKLGLAAFADHNFHKAAELLSKAGQNSESQLAKVDAKRTELATETTRNYEKAGDALYADYAFTDAIASYQKALSFVDRRSNGDTWAQINVEIGMASDESGSRTEGPAIGRLLAQAVSSYRAALEVYTRKESPQNWATTQNNLGIALKNQGTRSAGEEGRQLLAQAVAAYRAALEVRTREQLPQDWAMTQNNLGLALADQGTRSAGEEGHQLLAQAVASYRVALEVYTREQLPQYWAVTQDNLGLALYDQGTRSAGEEARKLLAQAVAAHRAALEVRTREQLPQDWATTQNNLGNALDEQGTLSAGEEGHHLLAQAVAAYHAALEVYTREQFPQDWAATQNNLGAALDHQGRRSAGEESRQLLAQAVAAYRAALEVRTREQLPQDWAMTQNNLGLALANQGTRSAGEEGRQLLAQAVAAYWAALEVYTREQLPQYWAVTQDNLGLALYDQGTRSAGEEARQLLAQAVAAYRAALEVRTRAQLPQAWAMTQNNLGYSLANQATRSTGEERRQLLAQAVAAYRAALEVRTRAQLPQAWVQTQNNLAEAYVALAQWPDAAESYRNVLTIYPDDEKVHRALADIDHDHTFNFSEALALHQTWLKTHPDDLSAQADWAESLLTATRFEEALTALAKLQSNPKLADSSTLTALRTLEIASLLALHQTQTIPAKLQALTTLISSQPPDFKLNWTWAGTLHFIQTDPHLAYARIPLTALITALQSRNRDAILTALRPAAESLSKLEPPTTK